jgi:hypothetical protein
MVAEDFVQDPQIRKWLDGVEPAWTLLTFDSLRALRQEPSAVRCLDSKAFSIAMVPRGTLLGRRVEFESHYVPLTHKLSPGVSQS